MSKNEELNQLRKKLLSLKLEQTMKIRKSGVDMNLAKQHQELKQQYAKILSAEKVTEIEEKKK